MTKATKMTDEQRDAAYERGWVHSLKAYAAHSGQPMDEVYYYGQGWDACAKYRWEDPSNRGTAPDPTFRVPRPRR